MELGLRVAIDANGRTICIAETHRGYGKRFVVRADEKLTALWNWSRQFVATNRLDTLA
jgi:hypothetical protein